MAKISISLDDADLEAIDAGATRLGLTRSALLVLGAQLRISLLDADPGALAQASDLLGWTITTKQRIDL